MMNPLKADPYCRMLAIMDHINECVDKYRAYKNHAINKDFTKEELRHELDKELMDLYILLSWQHASNDHWGELLPERNKRFKQNFKGGPDDA
jgi:hypothetical protein